MFTNVQLHVHVHKQMDYDNQIIALWSNILLYCRPIMIVFGQFHKLLCFFFQNSQHQTSLWASSAKSTMLKSLVNSESVFSQVGKTGVCTVLRCRLHVYENSVGLSSTTNPKPKGQPSISYVHSSKNMLDCKVSSLGWNVISLLHIIGTFAHWPGVSSMMLKEENLDQLSAKLQVMKLDTLLVFKIGHLFIEVRWGDTTHF